MSLALDTLRRTWFVALDFFLPSLCIVCSRRVHPDQIEYAFLCSDCEHELETVELPICPACGASHLTPIDGKYCRHCPPRPHYFDAARGVVRYNELAAELIKAFKYERLLSIGEWMGNMMFLHADKYLPFECDVVTTVPLHFTRRAQRGFNQADLIARRLCEVAKWRYVPDALSRVRATPKQTFMTPRERERNVRDAFVVVDEEIVRGRSIMIIDDVFTTGSSANECARMLRDAGAGRIIIFTFARAAG